MDVLPWRYLQASPSTVRTGQKSPQGWTCTKLWRRGFCIECQQRACCETHGHTSVSPTVRVSSSRSLRASSLSCSHRSQLWQQLAALFAW
jgi:hypothetical protein